MFIFIRITIGGDVVPERTFAQYTMEIITRVVIENIRTIHNEHKCIDEIILTKNLTNYLSCQFVRKSQKILFKSLHTKNPSRQGKVCHL